MKEVVPTVKAAQPQYDIGVIIGRFQVHELHAGHRDLIQYATDRHSKVVVLLGVSPLPNSGNNPLDFESRKQMILSEFPDVIVVYVKDQPFDETWSRKVDEIVGDMAIGKQTVVLYGGRDSFIDHYTGRFATQELLQAEHWSGREVRKQIARSSTKATPDFRAGAIWASTARYPTAFQTVDVAILNTEGTKLLLGRKPNEPLFRFIGGFSDPRSPSLEADAKREVMEEAGVEVDDIEYVGSMVVDDWRYRGEDDCIKTVLFRCAYIFGAPRPGDDIAEVRWFDIDRLRINDITPTHRPLVSMLFDNLHIEEN